MSSTGQSAPDPSTLIRSKEYRRLLVLAAIVGVLVSLASWAFLEAVHWTQVGLYEDLPDALGFDAVPAWWPLPILAVAGVLTAAAVIRLPGGGGHVPYEGIKGGVTWPEAIPGVLLAGLASLGMGLVLGPRHPSSGLALVGDLYRQKLRSDASDQVIQRQRIAADQRSVRRWRCERTLTKAHGDGAIGGTSGTAWLRRVARLRRPGEPSPTRRRTRWPPPRSGSTSPGDVRPAIVLSPTGREPVRSSAHASPMRSSRDAPSWTNRMALRLVVQVGASAIPMMGSPPGR